MFSNFNIAYIMIHSAVYTFFHIRPCVLHATKNVPYLKLSICNLNIEEVDHFNFLVLIIDKNMKWHTHVQKVANKIRNVNGILHKFKYVFPHIILILIYTSLI